MSWESMIRLEVLRALAWKLRSSFDCPASPDIDVEDIILEAGLLRSHYLVGVLKLLWYIGVI